MLDAPNADDICVMAGLDPPICLSIFHSSPRRKSGSSLQAAECRSWIPAFAGMTMVKSTAMTLLWIVMRGLDPRIHRWRARPFR
jgi:hypothetical protein